jgi:shikimate kinase
MADNVLLVGFMGAGKSSVGRILAGRLGGCFVETDDMITAKEGLTGGGLPCREGRPAALRALGTVVWLSGGFDALYARALRGGARPMLAGKSREEAEALYRSREAFYRQADLTVDTGGIGVDQVAARVLRLLRSRTRVSS